MNRKLTLLLDDAIINQAKEYAKEKNLTLSGMVEKYFKFLSSKNPNLTAINKFPELEKLSGIIKIPSDYEVKTEYRKYRSEKILDE
jgi:hypothetical protein